MRASVTRLQLYPPNPLLASTRPSRPTTTISSSVGAPARTRAAVAPCAVGDQRRQVEAGRGGELEGVQPAVGAGDRLRRAPAAPPAAATRSASAARSTAPRFEWRSSMPSASLVIFAGPPAMVTRATGWARRYFSSAADEIAHVDQRMVGQAVAGADGGLGRVAGRRADMGAAARARDVDAAMDRMDPGRAGIGHDDAGRAEDRQAADDAEPAVGGALGDLLAAGDRDLDHRRRRRRRAARRPRRDWRGSSRAAPD